MFVLFSFSFGLIMGVVLVCSVHLKHAWCEDFALGEEQFMQDLDEISEVIIFRPDGVRCQCRVQQQGLARHGGHHHGLGHVSEGRSWTSSASTVWRRAARCACVAVLLIGGRCSLP